MMVQKTWSRLRFAIHDPIAIGSIVPEFLMFADKVVNSVLRPISFLTV